MDMTRKVFVPESHLLTRISASFGIDHRNVRMPLQFRNDRQFCVLLQSIFTQLAPNARLLKTTKWGADIHDVVAIHLNRASAQPICNRARLLDVMGPDSGHQAIGGLICPTDQLVDIFEGNDAHDWNRKFLLWQSSYRLERRRKQWTG